MAIFCFLLVLLLNHASSFEAPGMCSLEDQEQLGLQDNFEDINTDVTQLKKALAILSDRLDRQELQLKELKEEMWLGNQNQPGIKRKPVKFDKGNSAGENAVQEYGGFHGKVLARFKPMFYDHFSLLAAVKAEAEATSLHTMHRTADGLSRFVVLGDAGGDLNFFSMDGQLLYEHQTGTTSAVTSMVSFGLDRNRTGLITGHRDGTLRKHVVESKVIRPYVGAPMEYEIVDVSTEDRVLPIVEGGGDGDLALVAAEITNLYLSRIDGKKIIFMSDKNGLLASMWSNGTMRTSLPTGRTIHSIRYENYQVAILHELGLSTMTSSGGGLHHMECSGLNHSHLETASFDYTTPSRAYAATEDGELLTLIVEKNFVACMVHQRQQTRLETGPFNLGILKGYIVMGSNLGIAIYNTTLSMRSGPRETLLESYREIASNFGQEVERVAPPQMATGGGSLVVLGFGNDGVVGIFKSHLPTQKPVEFNPKVFQQPLFIVAMVLVGFWQFSKHRSTPPNKFSSRVSPPTSGQRWL